MTSPLEPLLYGEQPLEGAGPDAVMQWQEIAHDTSLETRTRLQAWTSLRAAGVAIPDELAQRVEGVVVHVPIDDLHDVLAAYADGSVRYLNHNGAASIVEPPAPAPVAEAAARLLAAGAEVVPMIGPWEELLLPELPVGHARLLMLTPSGPCFGQGPFDVLMADPKAGGLFDAATALLQAVVSLSPS